MAALQRAWARLGFEYFRDGVHVLDLSLVTLDEKLGQLRENAERYRARRAQQASHQPGDTPMGAAPNIPAVTVSKQEDCPPVLRTPDTLTRSFRLSMQTLLLQRPDPAGRDRLVEVRDNLLARIAEAKREGWLGEVEGLEVHLEGARQKLAPSAHSSAGQ